MGGEKAPRHTRRSAQSHKENRETQHEEQRIEQDTPKNSMLAVTQFFHAHARDHGHVARSQGQDARGNERQHPGKKRSCKCQSHFSTCPETARLMIIGRSSPRASELPLQNAGRPSIELSQYRPTGAPNRLVSEPHLPTERRRRRRDKRPTPGCRTAHQGSCRTSFPRMLPGRCSG